VMWDMIQADRFASQFLGKDSLQHVKTETFKLYEEVFQLHKITKDEFVHSYKFYLSRPDINKVLFDSLSSWSNRQRADMYKTDSLARAITARADSIARVTKVDSIAKAVKVDSIARATKKDSILKAKKVKGDLLRRMMKARADSVIKSKNK
jgi:Domain of unknown function (DUF4296)